MACWNYRQTNNTKKKNVFVRKYSEKQRYVFVYMWNEGRATTSCCIFSNHQAKLNDVSMTADTDFALRFCVLHQYGFNMV